MGTTFIYSMIHISGWNPVLFSLSDAFIVDLSLFVGAINMVLAFALFICTAMIYACIKFLQEWATPLTVVNYVLLGMASGFALSAAFASYVESDLIHFYGGWAIVLTVAAFITRSASLIRNTRIKYKSNLSSAIGIRHTNIKQKAQGSMGGSFNTREYFHGAKPSIFKSIKWVFLVLVFVVPVALLSSALASDMFILYFLAFIVQYIGLLAERWFFFAQANHPQNLYYQTI
jgi:DMSO reductase anchor subunit